MTYMTCPSWVAAPRRRLWTDSPPRCSPAAKTRDSSGDGFVSGVPATGAVPGGRLSAARLASPRSWTYGRQECLPHALCTLALRMAFGRLARNYLLPQRRVAHASRGGVPQSAGRLSLPEAAQEVVQHQLLCPVRRAQQTVGVQVQ